MSRSENGVIKKSGHWKNMCVAFKKGLGCNLGQTQVVIPIREELEMKMSRCDILL